MFKNRIRDLRKTKNYTQEDIAKKLNISRPSYTRYETGEREPDFETIAKLSEIFNVSTDYLLGIIDETNHPSAQSQDPPASEGYAIISISPYGGPKKTAKVSLEEWEAIEEMLKELDK